jgi:hypothetical protein
MTKGRATLAAFLVVALALLAVAIWWQPADREPTGPSTGLKVVVIGVDGMDWFLTRQLLEEGALPATTSFLRRGITGEVSADVPSVPEVGWTILGRGGALTERELARVGAGGGRLHGLAPELAELVARSGGTALSVGWPASWPAGNERSLLVAPYRPESALHETGLPAAILGGDRLSCSADVSDHVAASVAQSEETFEAEFRSRIFDGPPSDDAWSEHLMAARWAFLSDLTTVDIAAGLMADEEPDLTMVCFSGLDAVLHRFLAASRPEFFPETPPDHERYADIVTNYFVFIDGCIERLRRLTNEEKTVFIVCSTYGTHPTLDVPTISGAHTEAPPGVFILRGPEIPRGQRAISLTTVDVAPTVLALLGLPIPVDMDGRVLQRALPPRVATEHPPEFAGSMAPAGADPDAPDLAAADAAVSARIDAIEAGAAR